ncbi:MAG: methylenetetrahydrofolate reductase [Dehalococcoidia bacterium]|nr:methylenetetrahydrofolate reductase [Dehalococcoidia bacterium]
MSRFAEALRSGRFAVTTEMVPPKGTDLAPLLEKAETLNGLVDGFNLTDSASSRMTMAPLAAAHLLLDRGLEPILQLTCRDRNRIALQSDLLSAHALGISNVLCMSGDDPAAGDHPDAKAVFDLDAITLLRAISSLNAGEDMMGHRLRGAPSFFVGAVANPGAADLDKELQRMEEKVEAGAGFFQTQAVYEPGTFEKFMDQARRFGAPVLAGHILLRSAEMARRLNATLPGFFVPEEVIRELEGAEDRAKKSVEIAARVIERIMPVCQGVHIMAVGWEQRIPEVLRAAGIRPAPEG